jgi:hypothetical protein
MINLILSDRKSHCSALLSAGALKVNWQDSIVRMDLRTIWEVPLDDFPILIAREFS